MSETLLWAFGLRLAQALIEASPTLLSGLVIAGILQRMVGPAGTRRLFGEAGWKGLVRSWALGMLLPVCSLGVLPVARVMRRSGVPAANVLAFMLVGPLLNPISFLYGLTLAEPKVICCYVVLTLLLALSVGLLWQRLFPRAAAPDVDLVAAAETEPLPAPGPPRLLAVAVTAARELVSPVAPYVLVGVVCTAALSAALPFGSMQHSMQRTDLLSPLIMVLIATPSYMGPLAGMMRVGLMFEHGNSVGAAFVLFVLGIGVNVGMIAWAVRLLGWKPAAAWFGMVIAGTTALAYAIEKPLTTPIEAAAHTHAFDEVTSPFIKDQPVQFEVWKKKVVARIETLESVGLLGLLLLALLAGAERASGLGSRLEAFLTRQPGQIAHLPAPSPFPHLPTPSPNEGEGERRVPHPPAPSPKTGEGEPRRRARWDVEIPGPVLGALALVGLIVFSVYSAYIYYPPRKQVFTEMAAVRAEALVAVRSDKHEEAIRRLEQWDLLTRKLQVGELLRTLRYDEEVAQKTDDLREAMEKVRDALLAGEHAEAKKLIAEVEKSYQACRGAYME
jgi:uncharacterized membrane protein YraQ (UPF0718 family)